jgi:hypothetical protein
LIFRSLKKAIFNLEDIAITKEMSVSELKELFFNSFGTHIKVYKSLNTGRGSQIASDETLLNDLKGEEKNFKEIFIKKNHLVGDIEKQFADELSIGIQVLLLNGIDFAPNNAVISEVKNIEAREIKEVNGFALDGRMLVSTAKKRFKEEFGLSLRIYDGQIFADEKATVASIRRDAMDKNNEFNPAKNMKISTMESKVRELFGIKVQIAGSDDSYLCHDDLTLAAALVEDHKKILRK